MTWILTSIIMLCGVFLLAEKYELVAQQTQKLEDYRATTERLNLRVVAANTALQTMVQAEAKGSVVSEHRTTIIKETLVGNNCANQPVPADTLRVQREGATRTH